MNLDTLTFPFVVKRDIGENNSEGWQADFPGFDGLGAYTGGGFESGEGIPTVFKSANEVLELAMHGCLELPRAIPAELDIFPSPGGELVGHVTFDIRVFICDHVPSSASFTDKVMFGYIDGAIRRNANYDLFGYPAVEIRNNWNRFVMREEVKNETTSGSVDDQSGETST